MHLMLMLLVWSPITATEYRSIDGTGNNLANPTWGAANTPLIRMGEANYPGDGTGQQIMGPPEVPNARDLSNAVAQQGVHEGNHAGLSDLAWLWGQFLDHDIDLTENDSLNGVAPIEVLSADDVLAPGPIPFSRSNFMPGTGTGDIPRQQVNQITSFIDGSVVYGSDATRAAELRLGVEGLLKTSDNNLLPMNTTGLPNAGGTGPNMFMAGDVRANENVGLTAMHTTFVREHNRLARLIGAANPLATDEEIYQLARRIVGAEIQVITYNEFLPALLGPSAPAADQGRYDPNVNPAIANEFSTALYRFGHSMLSSDLFMEGNGSMALKDAFFNPAALIDNPQLIDQLLAGFASHQAQQVDNQINEDVRSFLFGAPGQGGMDLAALNIQRGRDHGLPDYNTARELYGLDRVDSFDDITSTPELAALLGSLYDSVDKIDLWVGALAEDHLDGASVGPLLAAGISEQFERLRDGDRFFYEWDEELLAPIVKDVIDLEGRRLSAVIMDNTGIQGLSADAFHATSSVPEAASFLVWTVLMFVAAGRLATGRRTDR